MIRWSGKVKKLEHYFMFQENLLQASGSTNMGASGELELYFTSTVLWETSCNISHSNFIASDGCIHMIKFRAVERETLSLPLCFRFYVYANYFCTFQVQNLCPSLCFFLAECEAHLKTRIPSVNHTIRPRHEAGSIRRQENAESIELVHISKTVLRCH